jgi:monoamine oxidase
MWGLGYGAITKTAVQFSQRQWDSGYGTTDSLAQRLYDPSVDQDGESGIVMAYCGGDGGRELAIKSEAERIDAMTTDMRNIHGITAPSTGAFSRAWSIEPNYGGAYATYEPGQVTKSWDVLREPWARVHLAGEHVCKRHEHSLKRVFKILNSIRCRNNIPGPFVCLVRRKVCHILKSFLP